MTLYPIMLTMGGVGLAMMALSGGIGRGHAGHALRGGHGGHGGHAGHGGGRGVTQAGAARGGAARSGAARGGAARGTRDVTSALAALASPRLLFSLFVGFGATGLLLHQVLAGPALAGSAILGALGFERLLVTPLWNRMMRFAAEPATTLERCLSDEVLAVTSFDRNGQGLVAVELDGQVTQILATLRPDDLAAGMTVRAGDRLRVEDVDARRNCCTVSPLHS